MAWINITFLKIFCIIGFIRILPHTLHAYPTPVDFDHKPLRWDINIQSPDVLFVVTSSGPDDQLYTALAQEAAGIWSDSIDSYVRILLAEPHQQRTAQISVEFIENSSSLAATGFAEFDMTSDSGSPIHCSVTVFTSPAYSLLGIAKTILHEFGHCLGLGHSLIPESIMSYHNDKNEFDLDIDDHAALARLYPISGSPQLAPGCGVGLQKKTTSKYQVYLFLALLLTPIIALPFLSQQR